MVKKKVTLSLESKIYDRFRRYCNSNAIMLSRKIELVMKEIMEGEKIKK